MADKAPAPEVKKFSLKPIEKQMLDVLRNQYFTTLSNFLSFIALERLAYTVTENTKFEVQENGDLLISEAPPEEVAKAVEPAPEVATGTDTKTALKG